MEWFEKEGWLVGDVETRRGPITLDLFGVADLLVCRKLPDRQPDFGLVQVTSRENRASRVKRLKDWEKRDQWPGRLWLATVDQEGQIEWQLLP